MKINHKITHQVYKQIEGLLKDLPSLNRLHNGKPMVRIKTEYIKTDKEVELDKNGKEKIKLINHFKKGTEPILVNHKVNLISEYKKDGQLGIDNYLTWVKGIEEHSKKQEMFLSAQPTIDVNAGKATLINTEV